MKCKNGISNVSVILNNGNASELLNTLQRVYGVNSEKGYRNYLKTRTSSFKQAFSGSLFTDLNNEPILMYDRGDGTFSSSVEDSMINADKSLRFTGKKRPVFITITDKSRKVNLTGKTIAYNVEINDIITLEELENNNIKNKRRLVSFKNKDIDKSKDKSIMELNNLLDLLLENGQDIEIINSDIKKPLLYSENKIFLNNNYFKNNNVYLNQLYPLFLPYIKSKNPSKYKLINDIIKSYSDNADVLETLSTITPSKLLSDLLNQEIYNILKLRFPNVNQEDIDNNQSINYIINKKEDNKAVYSLSTDDDDVDLSDEDLIVDEVAFQAISATNMSKTQEEIQNKFKETAKIADGSLIEVESSKLPKKKRDLIHKVNGENTKVLVYKKFNTTGVGADEFLAYRVSDEQSIQFAKNKSPKELQQMENSVESKKLREIGTTMHKLSELIVKYLNTNTIRNEFVGLYNDYQGEQGFDEFKINAKERFLDALFYDTDGAIINTLFPDGSEDRDFILEFKEFSKRLRIDVKNNTNNPNTNNPFSRYKFVKSETDDTFVKQERDSEEYKRHVTKMLFPSLLSPADNEVLNEAGMLDSIVDLYFDAYKHQLNIDPNYAPMVLAEQFVMSPEEDKGGTSDLVFIYSDGSASIYDYKFIRASMKVNDDNNMYEFDVEESMRKFNRTKRTSYDKQLTTYAQMLTSKYGIKKINKVRIRPIFLRYTSEIDGEGNRVINENSAIADMFAFTSQVPLSAESTGSESKDKFIKKLEKQKENLLESIAKRNAWKTDFASLHKLTIIGDIIDSIKLSNDLSKYTRYINEFIENVEERLNEKIHPKDVRFLDLKSILELLEEKKLFDSFLKDAEELIEDFKKEDEESFEKFKNELGNMMIRLNSVDSDLNSLIVVRLKNIAKEQGMDEQIFDTYNEQPDINGISKLLLNMKSINHPLVRVFSQAVEQMNTNRIGLQQKIKSDIDVLNVRLKAWGATKGIKDYALFDILLNEDKNLVNKFSTSYYEDIKSRKASEDINWFKERFERSKIKDDSGKSDEDRFQEARKKYNDFLNQKYNDEDVISKLMDSWHEQHDIYYNGGINKAWFKSNYKSLKKNSQYYDYYLSDRFKELNKPENKPALAYYNYLIAWNYKFREMIGQDFNIKSNFVPMIHKDFMDIMASNGGSNMMRDYFNSLKNITEKDSNENMNLTKKKDIDKERKKELPLMFMDFIKPEERSLDLGKNLVIFATYISQYQDAKRMKDIGESIITLLKNTPETELDKKGNKIPDLSTEGKFKGITGGNKNIIEAMEVFINNYVYGETLQRDVLSDTIGEKGTRLVLKTLNASSKRTMAFNIPSALAGKINAHYQTKMVAMSGKYLKQEDISFGTGLIESMNPKLVYASYIFSIINDDTDTKANQSSISSFRQFVGQDITYFFQRWADNSADVNIMYGMMKNFGIDPITGTVQRLDKLKELYQTASTNSGTGTKSYFNGGKYKDIEFKSIWDSMVKVDKQGNIIQDSESLKDMNDLTSQKYEYVIINQFTGLPINFRDKGNSPSIDNEKTIYDNLYESADNKNELLTKSNNTFTSFRSKNMELIGRIKGNMSNEDISTYQTTLLGKMLGQYRRWIPSTMNTRLKSEQYNLVMEEFEVGKWRSIQALTATSYVKTATQLAYGLIPFVNHTFDEIDTPGLLLKYEQFIQNNPNLKNKVSYKEYVSEYKGQLRALAYELKVVAGFILSGTFLFWLIPDEEEEDSVFFTGLEKLLGRINLELGFFVPLPGLGLSEGAKMLEKSPIALINDLKLVSNLITNTFGEIIDVVTGTPSGKKYNLTSFNDEMFTVVDDSQGIGYNISKFANLGSVANMVGWNNTTDNVDTLWENIISNSVAFGKY